VGFTTPFHPDNVPGAIFEFAWHKIMRHTKVAIVNILGNFFSARSKMYSIQMPDIVGLTNTDDIKKIFINQDFPYQERKLPMVVVAIKSGKERKMYIGADNFLLHSIRTTSTGRTAVEVYAGAAEFTMAIVVVGQSPEERMKMMELIYMCFTHYYRWQYFYTFGDDNMMSLLPNTEELIFGNEEEAEGDSKISVLYVNDVTMKSFVEYTFSGLDIYRDAKNFVIDDESGPIIYSAES
jgi:hypothetical protein